MKNKTVLITGGSSGIGLEMAKKMAYMGNTVIICGRSQEKLDIAVKRNTSLIALKCDITKEDERKEIHQKIIKGFGGLDIYFP